MTKKNRGKLGRTQEVLVGKVKQSDISTDWNFPSMLTVDVTNWPIWKHKILLQAKKDEQQNLTLSKFQILFGLHSKRPDNRREVEPSRSQAAFVSPTRHSSITSSGLHFQKKIVFLAMLICP